MAALDRIEELRLRRLFAELRAEMADQLAPGFLPFRGYYYVAAQRWKEQMEQADLLKPITEADLEAVRRWDEAESARREQADRELAAYKQEKAARLHQPPQGKKKGRKRG